MKFWKLNGAGNDFILINNIEEKIPVERFADLARTLCERHLSIGADGMMVVESPSMGGDYRMIFYNSDGSLGEMCGNGARCICRYGYEAGLAGEEQRVETTAGLVIGHRLSQRIFKIRLNDPTVIELDRTIVIDGKTYPCSYVELGNPGIPHACVPYPGLSRIEPGSEEESSLRELGRKMRFYKEFPKGANVNFYEILGPDEIYEKTFERGVEDFTYACGTGTGSMVTALTLKGEVSGNNVRVFMRGGELDIDVLTKEETNHRVVTDLFLTGPTNIVAKGEVTDEELGWE